MQAYAFATGFKQAGGDDQRTPFPFMCGLACVGRVMIHRDARSLLMQRIDHLNLFYPLMSSFTIHLE